MLIDKDVLSEEALRGLADSFINTNVGNDYDDTPHEVKIDQALQAIKNGELLIMYSELHEEAHLIQKQEFDMKMKGSSM